MDDEVDIYAMGALGTAIKDMNAGSTVSRSNNDTNNEIRICVLGISSAAIKNTDVLPTTSEVNNNTDAKVDAGVIMGAISMIDAELTVDKLHRANTISGKEVYESILFWLLLTINESLVPKIVPLRQLLSRQYPIF